MERLTSDEAGRTGCSQGVLGVLLRLVEMSGAALLLKCNPYTSHSSWANEGFGGIVSTYIGCIFMIPNIGQRYFFAATQRDNVLQMLAGASTDRLKFYSSVLRHRLKRKYANTEFSYGKFVEFEIGEADSRLLFSLGPMLPRDGKENTALFACATETRELTVVGRRVGDIPREVCLAHSICEYAVCASFDLTTRDLTVCD